MDGYLLATAFDRNRKIIRSQAEGLGHSDSLVQTPYAINTLNWVVGHIVDYRSGLVETLGGDRSFPATQTARYRKESDPVTEDGPGVLALDELLVMLDTLQERLQQLLAPLTEDDLARKVEVAGRTQSLGERVHFLYFHDTYHTGQTELLRQVAGTGDKII
jgi:uncharacterized damage-inducible protein DinB